MADNNDSALTIEARKTATFTRDQLSTEQHCKAPEAPEEAAAGMLERLGSMFRSDKAEPDAA